MFLENGNTKPIQYLNVFWWGSIKGIVLVLGSIVQPAMLQLSSDSPCLQLGFHWLIKSCDHSQQDWGGGWNYLVSVVKLAGERHQRGSFQEEM